MTVAASGPVFSLREIPFSYRGSWFGFSPVIAEKTYAPDVHLVSHQTGMHAVLRFVIEPGATVTATPHQLVWESGDSRIELAYENVDTVRVRGRCLDLSLVAADPVLTPPPAYFQVIDVSRQPFVVKLEKSGAPGVRDW